MNIPRISESDLHSHLKARMEQRGVTLEELQRTRDEGWSATDVRPSTFGKTFVFQYARDWEGSIYAEKEVTVYYKMVETGIIVLTVKARYGEGFVRGETQ
jgi:hypothetical protein